MMDIRIFLYGGSGCVANIVVSNCSTSKSNWTLEFDYDRDITEMWSANIVSHKGNHYIIKGFDWIANVGANETLELGCLCGTGSVSDQISNVLFY